MSAGEQTGVVIRAHSQNAERLETTGAVLGLTRRTSYCERTVPVEPGDIVMSATGRVMDRLLKNGLPNLSFRGGVALRDAAALLLRRHADSAAPEAGDETAALIRFTEAAATGIPASAPEMLLAVA